MIEQALRRFCEFKHRKLTVIAGTIIVGLLLVMPLVDVIRAGRDEKATLLSELDSAQSIAAELQTFESRVTEKQSQLEAQQRQPLPVAGRLFRDEFVARPSLLVQIEEKEEEAARHGDQEELQQ